MNSTGETGLPGLMRRRLWRATGYSLDGLKACFRTEEAFRIQLVLAAVLVPAAAWVGESTIERLLLILVVGLVLIVELLNSAIEKAVDHVGTEYHALAKQAKDMGSAAVLISMLLCGLIWATLIWQNVING